MKAQKYILKITDFYYPACLKKAILRRLFKLVAKAFNKEIPPLTRLSYDKMLENFAYFTKNLAEKSLSRPMDISRIKENLFTEAAAIGRFFRRRLGISNLEDALYLGEILYKAIKIDLAGESNGRVLITKCYFSDCYTPKTCQFISALDRGLFYGLTGGADLVFSKRITEGNETCLAVLKSV